MTELKVEIYGEYRLESKWTSAWLKELKAKGFWAYKITDASRGKKPYDCIIASNLRTYHCEIKVVNSDLFYVKDIRDNQYAALRKISLLGQAAIIVVYSKKFNDYKIIPFEKILECGVNDKIKLKF